MIAMSDKEFNLLDEKWIRVLDDAYRVKEVSLVEAICSAHMYRDLAGEMPTQDVAVLRLMLAVLLTIFLRQDVDGSEEEVSDDNAVERWMALWERGSFPAELIREYLERYRDRFWLFHPEHPFYQVPRAEIGTDYAASKLNGEMAESSNKARLFPVRTGADKNKLTFSEAVRWLIYTNAYDDTSAKPKGKGLPSPGAGWLGKLGLIFARGQNLFETLMLNMTMLKDGEKDWGEPLPIWERELREGERIEIAPPNDPPGLLTLQSRRILLIREGEFVTGYSLLGGDFFERENAFVEQMTVWRQPKANNAKVGVWTPRRHDPSRQIWRDFPLIISDGDGTHRPGVVSWVARICRAGARSPYSNNKNRLAEFKIASVQYGDKDFFVTDAFSDTLSFSAGILADASKATLHTVESEIHRCEEIAKAYGIFAGSVYMASGGDSEQFSSRAAIGKEHFYHRIDAPFREWLREYDPSLGDDARDKMLEQWHTRSRSIVRALANETARMAGSGAFIGKTIDNGGRKEFYSVPAALNRLEAALKKID